jgi:glycosyltransferase involved in cell wall biosynthesis
VSICIPTYNRASTIGVAIESALAQTYPDIEVVVVDDDSTDDTVRAVEQYKDPRIRFHRNPRRLGQAVNRNRCAELSNGDLIKFLDSDDELDRGCVAELAELFDADPPIGMAFCQLRIVFEPGGEDPDWLAVWDKPHEFSGHLERVNEGPELLHRWLVAGFPAGWIGPPSVVMLRRSEFDRARGFDLHQHSRCDSDLWARLLPGCRVGYVAKELVTYLHGVESETTAANRSNGYWLDRAMTLEALYGDVEVRRANPELGALVRGARREAWRTCAKLGRGGDNVRYPLRRYLDYWLFRLEVMWRRLRSAVSVA